MLSTISQPISQTELRERVYRGEILHFQKLPAIQDFCKYAAAVCVDHMDCTIPVTSHRHNKPGEWQKLVFQYQQSARHSQECFASFSTALRDLGLDLNQTFCDRFIFRAVPPQGFNAKGAHSWVDTHRDTWGAGIYQQINWWGPVFPYPESTGIEFYVDHFDQAIVNTSANWNYDEYRAARKQLTAELKPDYKSIPSLLEKPRGKVLRPKVNPGDMLCFSAAQLHGSSINNTDNCRFSFETRTVNLEDIESGMKAPNCDNDSDDQLLSLFHNLIDGEQLEARHFKH